VLFSGGGYGGQSSLIGVFRREEVDQAEVEKDSLDDLTPPSVTRREFLACGNTVGSVA
jgi:hypothetical protein